jgi:hypothetical protein
MTQQQDVAALTEEVKELMRQEVAKRLAQEGVEPKLPEQTGPKAAADGAKITDGDLAAAKGVLNEIGGGDNIVVVPERVILGVGNHAVTIKDDSKVSFFRLAIDEGAYQGVDVAALKESIGMNTILVHPSVLGDPGPLQRGTIWHEHGHVLHGAAENGLVFAYEITNLRSQLGDDVAATFVKDHRKNAAYYTETAVNPGLDELKQQLAAIGYEFAPGEKAQAQSRAAAPNLDIGKVLRGDPAKVQALAGTDEPVPDLSRTAPNGTFEWAGHRWELKRRDVDYRITVTRSDNPKRVVGKSLSGSLAQLRGQTRDALKELPELEGKRAGDEFDWDSATWRVATVKVALQVEVKERLG